MFSFKKKDKRANPPEGQSFLLTALDNVEANIIESKLSVRDIPVFKYYREGGEYFTIILGKTVMGIDIFVPEGKIEEARNIIEQSQSVTDEDILNDPSFTDESIRLQNENELKSLSNKALWFGVALLLIIVAYMIYYILSI